MTGLACLAFSRAEYLAKLATRITSLATLALRGNVFHFSKELFDLKPHPGSVRAAYWIRSDLEHEELPRNPLRLQDRYSIRCAPHVIGVLLDALPFFRSQIETELNSTNDNPLIDADHELILHGGHFYGGHIAFVMDSMKNAVANIADLLDRQMALLMDTSIQQRSSKQSHGSGTGAPRDQSRLQSRADRGIGMHGRGAEADDAGQCVLTLYGVSQSRQSQHGDHIGPRLPTSLGADRAGCRGRAAGGRAGAGATTARGSVG